MPFPSRLMLTVAFVTADVPEAVVAHCQIDVLWCVEVAPDVPILLSSRDHIHGTRHILNELV